MLSGIGDGAVLKAHGIEVKHHLPGVGANYHDHLAAALLLEMSNTESYGISLRTLPRGVANLIEYALFRSGPLSSNVFECNAFVRTQPELDRPDIQVVFQAARRNKNTFPFPLGHGYAVSIVGLYPKSRGHIRLASADPLAYPIIDANLLSDPADVGPLLRGLQLARRIVASRPFARYEGVEVQPGPSVQTEEGLVDYIRRGASTVHHPCSSCRMGPDPNAVVDSQLRVHGIAVAAHRGCVRVPAHRRRQHQRAGRDDRGEVRRHDARPPGAEAGRAASTSPRNPQAVSA